MSFPATIRAVVDRQAISRVTRLFNGTLIDVLHELLQNCRRAGATRVEVETARDDSGPILIVRDDGRGIDDPAALLALGRSGWDDTVAASEDPAGMGIFSLAGRNIEIRSCSRSAGPGWRVAIRARAWEGDVSLPLEPCAMPGVPRSGSRCRMAGYMPSLPTYGPPRSTIRCRSCSMARRVSGGIFSTVRWRSRRSAAAGSACSVTPPPTRAGSISTACWSTAGYPRSARSTISCVGRSRSRSSTLPISSWSFPRARRWSRTRRPPSFVSTPNARSIAPSARSGRIDCPSPHGPRARDLGVDLPPAEAGLPIWVPATAENCRRLHPPLITGEPVFIVPSLKPGIAQAAASLLRKPTFITARPVEEQKAFTGYAWYDDLPRIDEVAVLIDNGDNTIRYEDESNRPIGMTSGVVDDLTLAFSLRRGTAAAEVETHRLPIDALVCDGDVHELDDALILLRRGADVPCGRLADQVIATLFRVDEDCESDSAETQRDRFRREARAKAVEFLQGPEAAHLERIRSAFHDEVHWLIPAGRAVAITSGPAGTTVEWLADPAGG